MVKTVWTIEFIVQALNGLFALDGSPISNCFFPSCCCSILMVSACQQISDQSDTERTWTKSVLLFVELDHILYTLCCLSLPNLISPGHIEKPNTKNHKNPGSV